MLLSSACKLSGLVVLPKDVRKILGQVKSLREKVRLVDSAMEAARNAWNVAWQAQEPCRSS